MPLSVAFVDGQPLHAAAVNATNQAVNDLTGASAKVPWSGGTAGILPATGPQPLTTQGGNTLDDGSGNALIKGGTLNRVTIGATTPSPSITATLLTTNAVRTLSGTHNKQWISQGGAIVGSLTGGGAHNVIGINDFVVADDTANTWALHVVEHVGSPATGPRGALNAFCWVSGAGTNTLAGASYVGVHGQTAVDADLGGTLSDPRGAAFGGWFQSGIGSNCDYPYLLTGVEIDVYCDSPNPIWSKIGLGVCLGSGGAVNDDTVQGIWVDAAINILKFPNITTGFRHGILFGTDGANALGPNPAGVTAHWPFKSDSTMIGTSGPGLGLPANIGVDFTHVTFTDAAFKAGSAPIELSAMDSAPTAASGTGKLYIAADGSLHYVGPTTDTEIAPA